MQHGGKPMLTTTDNAVIRAAIVRYLANEGVDRDASHELYHDDAILEFPQSGERFVGRETIREWRERYPSSTRFRLRRLVGSGSTWTAEILISYDGGPWMFGVGIYTFRVDPGGRVAGGRSVRPRRRGPTLETHGRLELPADGIDHALGGIPDWRAD
jgi:hypothetical protein